MWSIKVCLILFEAIIIAVVDVVVVALLVLVVADRIESGCGQ